MCLKEKYCLSFSWYSTAKLLYLPPTLFKKKKNQLEYISQKKEKKKRKYKNFSFEQDDLLLNTLRYDKEI